jgi:hypothetical protein
MGGSAFSCEQGVSGRGHPWGMKLTRGLAATIKGRSARQEDDHGLSVRTVCRGLPPARLFALDGNQIWQRSTSTKKGTVDFTTPVKISLSR